jgi:hypothetical protein
MRAMQILACAVWLGSSLGLTAQIKREERKSLLNSESGVVYLEEHDCKPIELEVIKQAPVFSDKEGRHRLGFLRAGQKVQMEALSGKGYRVRGQGLRDGIAGWVPPWAFQPPAEDFDAQMKRFYDRQIQVQELIAAKEVALGMTTSEVTRSRGKPTKTTMRRTAKGQSGQWEYIDYEEVKHYTTQIHPTTRQAYRVLSHIEQVEKGKTVVEFQDDVVTALEESETNQRDKVRNIVPPLVFGW